MAKNKHLGSNFEEFLDEEAIRADVEMLAIKKIIAVRLAQAMKKKANNKLQLAKKLETSRTQIDRLLDPDDTGVTLSSMVRASKALDLDLLVRLDEHKSAVAKKRRGER